MDINGGLTPEQTKNAGLASNKVARFSHTDAAYLADMVAGVENYSYAAEQNIPLSTKTDVSSVVLSKGLRTQSASLPRNFINHFFGRVSYNLNKVVDILTNLIALFIRSNAQNNNYYSATTSYLVGDVCFWKTVGSTETRSFIRTSTSPTELVGVPPVDGSNVIQTAHWMFTTTAFRSTHADDSDTLVSETPSDFHDAAQLTGAINLARIPAQLTGKNAATATNALACSGNAATATNALACSGNAATATLAATATNALSNSGIKKVAFEISAPATTGMTENNMFDIIAPFIPNTNDTIVCSGALRSKYYSSDWQLCCSLQRATASLIYINGVTVGSDNKARTDSIVDGATTLRYGYIVG